MKVRSCLSMFFVMALALGVSHRVEGQEQTKPPKGWQGPWPTPQQPATKPAPQSPYPSGHQVMEIPPQVQQPPLPPAQQQMEIPPRMQPPSSRPTQLLTVTVTDPQGRYVPGLQPEDFLVYEEDLPQQITYFATGQEEPVSLGFLVDTSSSMLNKISRARHALQLFFATIHPQDEVFLEAFNQRPIMVQDFTDSRLLLDEGTVALEPMGDTALYDVVMDGLRRVKQGRQQKRALILLTDGLDTASKASFREAVDAVRRSGVTVYTIGIGNPAQNSHPSGMGIHHRPFPNGGVQFPGGRWPGMGIPGMGMPRRGLGRGFPASPPFRGRGGNVDDSVDVQVLQTFSSETGGKHFLLNTADVIGNEAVLDQAVQAISDELRQQYTIGYRSPLKGDVYRSVHIEMRRPSLSARAQKGLG